jgi:hypothetical protein
MEQDEIDKLLAELDDEEEIIPKKVGVQTKPIEPKQKPKKQVKESKKIKPKKKKPKKTLDPDKLEKFKDTLKKIQSEISTLREDKKLLEDKLNKLETKTPMPKCKIKINEWSHFPFEDIELNIDSNNKQLTDMIDDEINSIQFEPKIDINKFVAELDKISKLPKDEQQKDYGYYVKLVERVTGRKYSKGKAGSGRKESFVNPTIDFINKNYEKVVDPKDFEAYFNSIKNGIMRGIINYIEKVISKS